LTRFKATKTDRSESIGTWGEYTLELIEGVIPDNPDEEVLVEYDDHVRQVRYRKAGFKS
jgi:hypothetical protein